MENENKNVVMFVALAPEDLTRYEATPPGYEEVFRGDPAKKEKARFVEQDGVYVNPEAEASMEAHILCVGDLMCEQGMYQYAKYNDAFWFHGSFRYVEPVLKKADLVVGSLATMLSDHAPYTGEVIKIAGKHHLNAPGAYLEALRYAGLDFLALANNHNCDVGINGIRETLYNLKKHDFGGVGLFDSPEARRFLLADVNGIRIGLLSYSTTFNRNEDRFTAEGQNVFLNLYGKERLEKDVAAARENGAEFILAYMNWGEEAEYKNVAGERQVGYAQEIADAGVDYIVGTHPHVLQQYTVVTSLDGRQVPVLYSLGNFVTSDDNTNVRDTAIISLNLLKKNGKVNIIRQEYIPCRVIQKYDGARYTTVPAMDGMNNGDEERAFSQARGRIAKKIGRKLKQYSEDHPFVLTTSFICAALDIPDVYDYGAFRRLSYAPDVREGDVAVLLGKPGDTDQDSLAALAMEKGAKLLISTRQIAEYPCLEVENIANAYNRICMEIRKQYDVPKTVAVTGSIGKTTTTQLIATVLASKWNTHKNTSSSNNYRLAGYTLQALRPENEAYVQEVMEGPPYGAASTIAKMVQPRAAVVTVVGTSHLESFGSQERILETCLGIQDGMPDDGVLFLNGDDRFQITAQPRIRTEYYAIDNPDAAYRAENIVTEVSGTTFDLICQRRRIPISLTCIGRHNVYNALAAFAVGKWSGMTDMEIRKALGEYRTSGIRQNLIRLGKGNLYIDCYNASPESIQSALDTISLLSRRPNGGRKVAFLGDIVELGDQSVPLHRKVGGQVLASDIDLLICYGRESENAAKVVQENGKIPAYFEADEDKLIELYQSLVTSNDIVMVKGSHAMQLERLVDRLYGTWMHEEFAQYEYLSQPYEDAQMSAVLYSDHVTITAWKEPTPEVYIPATIQGRPVTGIGRNVFSDNQLLEKIELPDTLRNIRYAAFYKCGKLSRITIPKDVRIIERSAFSTCTALEEVMIENGTVDIGYRAFGYCRALEKAFIPESVERMDDEAFVDCEKLTICGVAGSYAEEYAQQHSISFLAI